MENESSKKPASDPLQPTLASLPVKIEYAEEREKENSLGINLLTLLSINELLVSIVLL